MKRPQVRVTSCRATAALVGAVVTALSGLAGCSSPAPGAGAAPSNSPLSAGVPLDATLVTASGAVAVVPMGRLGDRDNTFWELFFRRPGSSRWLLVTPAGVADNGGLVVSREPGAGGATVSLVGFEPSQSLVFSPLASSTDLGATWSPGLVPGGLAAVPDALSSSPGAGLVSLLRAGGGEVFKSAGNPSAWAKFVTRHQVASSGAGRSCGPGDLSAVAIDSTGEVQVASSCTTPGVVGIFAISTGSWHLVGSRLSGRLASSLTKVVRLVDLDGVDSGLVSLRSKAGVGLIGVTGTEGGVWSHSALLPLQKGDRIASTGVEPGGGFVVLLSRADRSPAIDAETGPGGDWQELASPPPGTAAVSMGPAGEVDALAVASTMLTDWRLDASAGTWSKIGTVTVPIQFGSSF